MRMLFCFERACSGTPDGMLIDTARSLGFDKT